MARRMHRTAAGRMVDIEALMLSNEQTIAVGNMRTNARGDELGPGGRVVKTKGERMNEAYGLHTMIPTEGEVDRGLVPKSAPTEVPESVEQQEHTPAKNEDPFKGGLANALAKTVKIAEPPKNQPPKTSKLKRI